MKIIVFLRNNATVFAVLAAVAALILFIPAALTASVALRVFLIIFIVLLLGSGVTLLYFGSRRNGPQVHYFLYDRRRGRSCRYADLDAGMIQDAVAFYIQPFAQETLTLWKELPKPFALQLNAQPHFIPLVAYRLFYLLSDCDAEQIYQIFSQSPSGVLTFLCRAIGAGGDNEMADFIYHLKHKKIEDRERIVQFFRKNKQNFAQRALRYVQRNFDLFYVPKSMIVK